ncbi:chorismate mutase [Pseudomonas sp. UBA800]|nr:chorismate mutase [Pseudomonas sp. UBA800]
MFLRTFNSDVAYNQSLLPCPTIGSPRIKEITMRLAPVTLTLTLGLLGCQNASPPQTEFAPLLSRIEQRLDLASAVAGHKWDQQLPVQATDREHQVLAQVREAAPHFGLSPGRATAFFDDQIEASKLIQYSLLNRWAARGKRPATTALDLADDIRPRLDELQATLLFELARFDQQPLAQCRKKLAQALARRSDEPVRHQALVRATANLCAAR